MELHQEDNATLAYWLSNTVTLLYLMQKNVKPASGGGYAARIKASGQQVGQQVRGRRAACWAVCMPGCQGAAGSNRAHALRHPSVCLARLHPCLHVQSF